MGFWSTLAKIGGDVGGSFIGDPMLGNQVVGAFESPAGEIGQTAGNIENQRMNALIAQAKLQQQQDANQIAKNKAVLDAPQALAKNAVRGDVLANAQDATVSGLPSYITVPTIGGGLRPSLFSAATRNLGSQMSTKALNDFQSGTYTNPALTPLPEASAFDKVLSGTALAGGFLNATRGLLPKITGDSANTTGGVYGPWQPPEISGEIPDLGAVDPEEL